jgi:hypothetical protein
MSATMSTTTKQTPEQAEPTAQTKGTSRARWALLALILLAFAHVTFLLDAKPFWWDESLSLQRAEQGLGDLLRGVIWIGDGFSILPTIDQHPFFSFLLQGALIRLAGDSEFVVRFVSAMAATLLVPILWVQARWLVRRGIAASATPWLAALLGAISPFMLWYGQEARPYALWATLAVLTTYLLLRATERLALHRGFAFGFAAAELLFLTTHYYAVLLLPLHALILFAWLWRRGWGRALAAAALFLAAGSLVAAYGAYTILAQGGGQNFSSISLGMLVPDLLNAFSLGLSVDLARVWWIDWVFAALALGGAVWGLRSRASATAGGWVLPAFLLIPIALLLLLNELRPLYMNARHLSLLAGAFILLCAGGLALLWQGRLRWTGALVTLGLVAAIAYSTVNYHTLEEYAKDDYRGFGSYLSARIMPGDAVLFYPPSSWRIFQYYVPPTHAAAAAQAARAIEGQEVEGKHIGVYGIPLLFRSMEETEDWLRTLGDQYDRVWVLKSGTHPYFDEEWHLEQWLPQNMLQVRNAKFFSHSSLRAQLYLPDVPVFEALPPDVQHPLTAEFGNLIRLAGYSVEPGAQSPFPTPLRLYWQVLEKPQRRYKYIVQLVEQAADGSTQVLGSVEREPYEGDIPTLYWDPGKTIMEYVEFPLPTQPPAQDSVRFYTVQMYDAETLEMLPLTRVADGAEQLDPTTVRLPQ